MSQFQEIENSLKYSKADTTGGKLADATFRYGASQATSFVPNVVSGVAQGVDGTVRDTYNGDTVWENSLSAMKSKIPGLRETLPAALDNWGQEKKYTGTAAENFLNATLNPGSVTKYRTSAVNQELYRLGENIDIKYPEKKAPNSGNRDGEKVSLDQDERRQYQMAYGQTAYDNIQKVIRSSVYKQSSDAEKAAAIQNLLEVATSAGKKKAKLDGGDTPAWTTKSTGTIGENAVYKAMLGTAKDALPEDKRTKTGNVLQSVLKTAGNKRGGDNLMLNIMAQQLSEGTQDKFETAYNGGYELKQIVDFYQAKYATKPGTSQRKYKKADLYRGRCKTAIPRSSSTSSGSSSRDKHTTRKQHAYPACCFALCAFVYDPVCSYSAMMRIASARLGASITVQPVVTIYRPSRPRAMRTFLFSANVVLCGAFSAETVFASLSAAFILRATFHVFAVAPALR